VLASSALELAADESAQNELLPPMAAGERVATLAYSERDNPWQLAGVTMEATSTGDSHTLTGRKVYVLDGHVAHDILVAARVDGELTLFHVDAAATGLKREALPALDPTRKLANLDFDATPARRISSGDAAPGLERALTRTLGALAAEQLGGSQLVLEMATDYAKSRLQFGRPIGSYQAIKHKCANMLVDVEFARSAAYNAAFADDSDAESSSIAAAMAKSYCSEAYYHAADDNIQIHGGMGFTWEHNAHLYYKRAKASEILFGSPVQHRERVAASLGIA
jgi:alkylation response protein AidB-like acyl-CoA dehydrogenase